MAHRLPRQSALAGLAAFLGGLLIIAVPIRAAGEKLGVASLSTITTEIAREVGGERVEVAAIVGPGVDPHEFEPKPEDVRRVGDSQLILATGKGLEGYLTKLKESSGSRGTLLEVGKGLPSLKLKADEGPKAGQTVDDPHWWHSADNVERATLVVRDALTKLSPADKDLFSRNAEAYRGRLEELKRWIKGRVAELPRDRRKLVTSHDAFQYFARDYGFTIYPIGGVSSEDEPSSRKVAELLGTIRKQRVKAVFFENIENPKVIAEITKETGAAIGGELYADGLGATDSEAATYDAMMRHNVNVIVNALK